MQRSKPRPSAPRSPEPMRRNDEWRPSERPSPWWAHLLRWKL
ncbi:MAG: hypothetical protein AAF447_12835 [Myxococcota bacterium]